MKEHTEKQPIDELFARKLGGLSLPPKADGFERLQARMGQTKPEKRILFWRNPVTQHYMAAAACLLLVCLFGWLYWPSGGNAGRDRVQVAANQQRVAPSQKVTQQQNESDSNVAKPTLSNPSTIAMADELAKQKKQVRTLDSRPVVDNSEHKTIQPASSEPILAQTKPADSKTRTDAGTPIVVAPASQPVTEQLAENKTVPKPTPVAERVLVVTIAEPATLIAARQAAKASMEEKQVVALNEKADTEAKGGNLWQQVKRIKQGDVFARQDNAGNDDRGLLDRAYSGLKHSFDKDKSVKQ